MASTGSTTAPGAGQAGRPLRARVDLGRLVENLGILRRTAGGLGLLPVVKADAYGHGAVQVAGALAAAGVEGFCVAILPEALELRQAGIAGRILVFGGVRGEDLPLAAELRLDLTVVSADHLRELAAGLPQHPVGLHLKLDTGMGRSGLLLAELGACLDLLRRVQPWLQGLMGHFSSAEDPDPAVSDLQRQRFLAAQASLRAAGIAAPMVHHANSAGCLRGFTDGDTHVRPGIALYGLADLAVAQPAGLRPILELDAEAYRAVCVPAGTTVGYGGRYVAPGPVRLVTLACGYADGYPRALAGRARVGFRGATYPVVGMISMDSLTVALPEDVAVNPGDRMVLLSREPEAPHSVLNTARLLGTITYEVTCALNRRVVRSSA